MQARITPAQPDSALHYARKSGIANGGRVLANISVGVTVSPAIIREGALVTVQEATLHFCSSGWTVLRQLPTLQSAPQMPEVLNITCNGDAIPVSSLPQACFIDAEFEVMMLHHRLHLTPRRIIRAAAIPPRLHDDAPWAFPRGRQHVFEYMGARSFEDWLQKDGVALPTTN